MQKSTASNNTSNNGAISTMSARVAAVLGCLQKPSRQHSPITGTPDTCNETPIDPMKFLLEKSA